MHTCSVHINLLGLPRPKLRRSAVLKVFPSDDEVVPCLVIAAAIILGLLAACFRIC
jgi:hypothetical protein